MFPWNASMFRSLQMIMHGVGRVSVGVNRQFWALGLLLCYSELVEVLPASFWQHLLYDFANDEPKTEGKRSTLHRGCTSKTNKG